MSHEYVLFLCQSFFFLIRGTCHILCSHQAVLYQCTEHSSLPGLLLSSLLGTGRFNGPCLSRQQSGQLCL